MRLGRTLVSASVQGLDGQLSPSRRIWGRPIPACAASFPRSRRRDALPSCAQGGVLGPAAGVIGRLQAVEVVKEILGLGRALGHALFLYDALGASLDRVRVRGGPSAHGGASDPPAAGRGG